MINNKIFVHPIARIVILICGLVGSNIATLIPLLVGYVLVLGLLMASHQIKQHARMILISGMPILIVLVLIYVVIPEHVQYESLLYPSKVFVRVLMLLGLFQFSAAIGATQLIDLLNTLKISRNYRWLLLQSFSSVQDVVVKVDQIVTARFARGVIKRRNLRTRLLQVPYIFRPLIGGLLMRAFDKSYNWEQLRLMEFLDQEETTKGYHEYPIFKSLWISIIMLVWLIATIVDLIRLNPT